jgi:hypothetical protein
MQMAQHFIRWGGARMSRRLSRSLPWIGAALALLTVADAMKRKGVVRGGVDTALNALPLVGAIKNMAETVRGRDFLKDRPHAPATTLRR